MTIEERVSSAGGGWLVSWKDGDAVKSELPDPKRFSVSEKFRGEHLAFYQDYADWEMMKRDTEHGGHGGPPHYRDQAACEVCGIAIEPAPTRIGRMTRL